VREGEKGRRKRGDGGEREEE